MNIQEENEFLRKALEVRRMLQGFLDRNLAPDEQGDELTASFTLDGKESYPVTWRQKAALMLVAPESVRKIN